VLTGLSHPLPTTLDELLGPSLASRLDRLDIVSRKLLAGKLPGERRSKRRGRSVEFDDFRPYVAGDDLRHIDWNIVGRLDRLFIKLFREEEDLALHLIIDASASMDVGAGERHKLLFACRLAMALAYLGLVNQNRVSVATFGVMQQDGVEARGVGQATTMRKLAPMRGRASVRRAADFVLATLAANHRRSSVSAGASHSLTPEADFADSIKRIARTSAARGVTVVLSDFLLPAAAFPALGYLQGVTPTTHDTLAVQVLTPEELDPAAARDAGLLGDLRLIDVETGRGKEVTITPASIARYRAALSEHQSQLRQACTSRGIALSTVPTSTPLEDLLFTTLRQGGLIR
jgi:uncharacterized protein (DUF58 family)